MNLGGKLRPVGEQTTASGAPFAGGQSKAADHSPSVSADRTRQSNGLKEFLWLLSDVERGHLLDLGPAWQATINFFTSRGFKVYADDLLRSWRDALRAEEERLRTAPVGARAEEADPAARAERFMQNTLVFPAAQFHAVLAWDLFDYLDADLVPRVAGALCDLLRPGGVLLAIFHSRTPAAFLRYRILDPQTIELLPAPALVPPQRIFQNREILNLFSHFRSTKTFVGRDQIREALILK